MIPINELQGLLYQKLNSSLDIKIYDEVPKEASMPLLTISDYSINQNDSKCEGYKFNWNFDIYTDYEGKKQVNGLLTQSIDSLLELIGSPVGDIFTIDDITINEARVSRVEGYYVANLVMQIELV